MFVNGPMLANLSLWHHEFDKHSRLKFYKFFNSFFKEGYRIQIKGNNLLKILFKLFTSINDSELGT